MATCMSQLYHEHKRGVRAGYAKFETFPIWNLPLDHPVNLAYEAATADLNDVNMLDPFHLEAYGQTTVNYNRDVEIFPVVRAMFNRIYGECPYKSPTDMGVNMVGNCIVDDDACRTAARLEIIRRYFHERCSCTKGLGSVDTVNKIKLLLNKTGITTDERPVIAAATDKADSAGCPAAAIDLGDGRIATGRTSSLLGASAAVLLNAIKMLGDIDDDITLISPTIIEPVQRLKVDNMGNHNPRLHTDEVLIALSICAVSNPIAAKAMEQLPKLHGLEAHSSVMLSSVDENVFRKLGMNLTCEPQYQTKKLYHA
jgi:uncharacterized protein (UPF0371 family)